MYLLKFTIALSSIAFVVNAAPQLGVGGAGLPPNQNQYEAQGYNNPPGYNGGGYDPLGAGSSYDPGFLGGGGGGGYNPGMSGGVGGYDAGSPVSALFPEYPLGEQYQSQYGGPAGQSGGLGPGGLPPLGFRR